MDAYIADNTDMSMEPEPVTSMDTPAFRQDAQDVAPSTASQPKARISESGITYLITMDLSQRNYR